jgi:hypothetical protein
MPKITAIWGACLQLFKLELVLYIPVTQFSLLNNIKITHKNAGSGFMGNSRVLGLIMFSAGLGMLLVLFLPGWGFAVAAFMALMGFNLLFGSRKK